MRKRCLAGLVALVAVAAACSSDPGEPTEGAQDVPEVPSAEPQGGCVVEPAQVWVEEGELATAVVDCADADISLVAPVGVEVSGNRLRWTPQFDQAGTHRIEVEAGSSSATWVVGVADAFDHAENRPVADPQGLTDEFGLEVLHLFPEAHLGEDSVGTTLMHGGRTYEAEVRVRGASSLEHPKVGLDVFVEEGFQSADPTFDGLKQLALLAGFDDNSQLRNRLAQELWSDMSGAHLDVAHASVVVYLDGRYMGVYTLIEELDAEYLERNGLGFDAQLFKADDERADFRMDDDPDATAGFDKKNGEPESGIRALDPIGRLVEFAALADDATFASDLDSWVEVDDIVDWLAFVSFIAASDSTAKNAFWYQPDPDSAFRYIPWDFNHSFGQDWITLRVPPDAQALDFYAEQNGLFERIYTDPVLRAQLLERYDALLDGAFSPDNLSETVAEIAAELGRNLERDERRWGDDYNTYRNWNAREDLESSEGEIAYIVDWIAARHVYMEAAVQQAHSSG